MEIVFMVGIAILQAGVAYGAVKSALNGTAKRVERIDIKLDAMIEDHSDLRERVAIVETRVNS